MSCIAIRSDAIMPYKGSPHAAGFDLASPDELVIDPGQRKLVKTGLRVICPDGTYGRIAPRSGLAVKFGVDVLAGVVDADYRGEVGVVLINFGDDPVKVAKGTRIAQLIFEKYDDLGGERGLHMTFESEDVVTKETERGEGGFGSTGH